MTTQNNDWGALAQARHSHPHGFLGLHPATRSGRKGLVARAYLQDARSCELLEIGGRAAARFPMKRVEASGGYEVLIPDRTEVFRYRLRVERHNGEWREFSDPYSFLPTLSDQDLYLFNEGTEHRIYQKLGAHRREVDGVPGVSFAVWSPNASRVSVVGDFNHWDGRYHPMRSLGSSGVWELFIPGLENGALYKYEILPRSGELRLKTDPYGSFFEGPPGNASVVCDVSGHRWADQAWMEPRARLDRA